jgi:TetR/AcrR family transcriptional repressor of nem operon
LLPGKDKRAARSKAILMSALVGAISRARAVSDRELSRKILDTVGAVLKTLR